MDALPSRHPDPDRPPAVRPAPVRPGPVRHGPVRHGRVPHGAVGHGAPEPVEPEFTVRLSDGGELAAALPHLVGFPPCESIVLVGLGGASGKRIGLTMRVDIPPDEYAAQTARALAARLDTDGPDAAVLAVVSEAPDVPAFPDGADELWDGVGRPLDLPYRQLAWHMSVALAAYGIPLRELLLVRAGRWWSYDCPDPCCAPGAGTVIPAGVSELEAASVAAGQVVARSREELESRIARSVGHEAESMAQAVLRIGESAAELVLAEGYDGAADRYWGWITDAVARCGSGPGGERLTDDDVARVVWGLRDKLVRDRALGLCLGADADAAERLWTDCTRRAAAPLDAAPATLLGVSSWVRGNGAMARIALDRALESEPDYALACLLARGLDGCLPPRELRAMIVGTLADLGALSDLGIDLPDDLLADFHDAFPGEDPYGAPPGPDGLRASQVGAIPRRARARRGRRSRSSTRPRRSPE